MTVAVDRNSGRLVWAAAGRDDKTVQAFFDALGQQRGEQITLVSCDMAGWIAGPVADRLPDAMRCVDRLHVIQVRHERCRFVRGARPPSPGGRGGPES